MNKINRTIKKSKNNGAPLQVINYTAAGIDIGANELHVCAGKKDGSTEVIVYPTFTKDLQEMVVWLEECGTSSAAMESTGPYWIPVYDMLEEAGLNPALINAYHLKTVPGRKTDVKDCEWIQQLHSYGLLQGSFRPKDDMLKLRTYIRQRSKLFQLATTQVNLMHKALAQMNIQLRQVINDITGETGTAIIRAIVAGERNPKVLAEYRNRHVKKTKEEIAKSLEGNYKPELVFVLKQSLQGYNSIHDQIIECEKEIEQILETWKGLDKETGMEKELKNEEKKMSKQKGRKKTSFNKSPYYFDIANKIQEIAGVDLTAIPGIDANTVAKIISEIGVDMSAWPTEKHFASWLGLCPGNKISGGKILSGKTKPTANKAAQALRLAANSLYQSNTALGAYFRRMRARLGTPKAITATAHKLAVIIYCMLKEGKEFKEIGAAEYEKKFQKKSLASLRKRAAEAGFDLVPKETIE
jgi:transposase